MRYKQLNGSTYKTRQLQTSAHSCRQALGGIGPGRYKWAQVATNECEGCRQAQAGTNGHRWLKMSPWGYRWAEEVTNVPRGVQMTVGRCRWSQAGKNVPGDSNWAQGVRWAQWSTRADDPQQAHGDTDELKWLQMSPDRYRWFQVGTKEHQWLKMIPGGYRQAQGSMDRPRRVQMSDSSYKWVQGGADKPKQLQMMVGGYRWA